MVLARFLNSATFSRMMHAFLKPRTPYGLPAFSAAASQKIPVTQPQWRLCIPAWSQFTTKINTSRTFHTSCISLQEPTAEEEDLIPASPTTAAPLPLLTTPGHIELVIGPMFAGKSSELLRRVASYESQGLTVAIVKSNKDDRYSASHVVTHDGLRKECHAVPTLTAFRELSAAAYASADVIAVDEAQFFSDLTEFCMLAADGHAKRVVLAGLDGDFMRRRFGQVLDLVPLADKVTKLTAICKFCQEEEQGDAAENGGNRSSMLNLEKKGGHNSSDSKHYPAVFSLRIAADNDQQEVVGGADKYAPVCRRHYVYFTSKQQQDSRNSNGNGTSNNGNGNGTKR